MCTKEKIGCIVQARTTSTRLPGKVMKIVDYENGNTILDEVLITLKKSKKINEVIVATTVNEDDDVIVEAALENDCTFFRGSEEDVLERYYLAAKEKNLDIVIRITSDCPFIDYNVIDDLIDFFKENNFDYASNAIERTFPHGLDCEIFSFDALEKAYKEGKDSFYREHVTSYIYNHKEEFKLGCLKMLNGQDYSNIRITVDTKEDYILACTLKDLMRNEEDKGFMTIVSLFNKKPYLSQINGDIIQKRKYTEKEEIAAALHLLELQEMKVAANIIKEHCNE